MFLKAASARPNNAENTSDKIAFPYQIPITLRLTLLYSLSSFTVLTLSALFLYGVLVKNITMTNAQVLENQAQVITGILKKQPLDMEALESEIVWEPTTSDDHYYARLLDQDGGVIMETLDMTKMLKERASIGSIRPLNRKVFEAANKHFYQLATTKVELDAEYGKTFWVQVALDVSLSQYFLSKYRIDLILVLLVGVFLSAALGAFVARRGMAPLRQMAEVIEHINVEKLHARLEASFWPQELMALVRAFNELLDRIETAFMQLSQFSADLAHELRTPINNLMGEVETVLTRPRSIDEYQQVLGSSLEECGKLSNMIDRMLFLARAEHPEAGITSSKLDLHEEMLGVKEFYDAVAEEQGVEVVCEGDATVMADPNLLRRVLINLLSNALKYTTTGDRIILSTGQTKTGNVYLRVEDTGEGIPEAHLPFIFDRFHCVDASRSRKKAGTGLGLAIVKSIVELHHAEIRVDSELGRGTLFEIVFPI